MSSNTNNEPSCNGCEYCYVDYFGGQIYRECTLEKMYSPNLGMYESSPKWCPLKNADGERKEGR